MSKNLNFLYRLRLADAGAFEFPIQIDASSCTFVPSHPINPQPWTALEYRQCGNCPLSKSEWPHCPAAVNLTPLLELCSSIKSYENVELTVTTEERTISGTTTMQRALSSILGLIMATSPCPHTEFLKPMARFHLPLASEDETIYRTTSMYLLAQYFRRQDGLDFSLDLEGLTAIYRNLQIINKALAERLKAAVTQDATVNAVIMLDLLSKAVTWSIEDGLGEMRYLFKSYGIDPNTGS